MNTFEKIEMAELILEIMSKDNSLCFQRSARFSQYGPPEILEISANAEYPTIGKMSRNGYLPALRFIVDKLRAERGEPSREETAAQAEKEDISHAESPPVAFGPGAACSCGSRKGLTFSTVVPAWVDWIGGKAWTHARTFHPQPGAIGSCRDCGKSYRFGA